MQLSPQQEEAIKVICAALAGEYPQPLTTLEGYAGTGKSTILPFILEKLGFDPGAVRFVAPTGKAAKVMRTKLQAQQYPNTIATTIHSAIYRARPAPIATLESDLYDHHQRRQQLRDAGRDHPAEMDMLNKQIKRLEKELEGLYVDEKVSFQLNVDSPIRDAKLIVVDEASMVGRQMAEDLMFFGVPVLAMGDPGQLPPVQDDPGLTGSDPDYCLTEIHRQAADNPILQLATMVREGKVLKPGVYGDGRAQVIRRRDFNNGEFDWDAPPPQFIVGTNTTRWRITRMLRDGYGILDAFPRGEAVGPQAGEPLMVCKNVQGNPSLVNGCEVKALSSAPLVKGQATFNMEFEDEDGVSYGGSVSPMKVFQGLFEEHYSNKKGGFSATGSAAFRARKNSVELDWAWAITCHKSQGSQWSDVVVLDESGVFKQDSAKWLYTAVTRAADKLTVLV